MDAALDSEVAVEPGEEAVEWIVELFANVRILVGDAALDRLADTLPGNVGVSEARSWNVRSSLYKVGSTQTG